MSKSNYSVLGFPRWSKPKDEAESMAFLKYWVYAGNHTKPTVL